MFSRIQFNNDHLLMRRRAYFNYLANNLSEVNNLILEFKESYSIFYACVKYHYIYNMIKLEYKKSI